MKILFTRSSLSDYCEDKCIKIISGRKLMPKRVIAVCPETRTKRVNTLCRQKVEIFECKISWFKM